MLFRSAVVKSYKRAVFLFAAPSFLSATNSATAAAAVSEANTGAEALSGREKKNVGIDPSSRQSVVRPKASPSFAGSLSAAALSVIAIGMLKKNTARAPATSFAPAATPSATEITKAADAVFLAPSKSASIPPAALPANAARTI